MARSNMFANMENQFEFCDTEEITEKTLQGYAGVIGELGDNFEGDVMFMTLILAAKLGVASKCGTLNSKEKALVDSVFGQVWNGDMEEVYDMVAKEITDNDYNLVEMLAQMGNNVALPFLYMVLGFAYIDEKVNDQIMEKLDGMFGMNLLALFMQSGLEEVPAPQVKLVGLEADIVEWFESDDQLRPLKDIVAHFPGKSESEVKSALDSLCDKEILYGTCDRGIFSRGDDIGEYKYGLA